MNSNNINCGIAILNGSSLRSVHGVDVKNIDGATVNNADCVDVHSINISEYV